MKILRFVLVVAFVLVATGMMPGTVSAQKFPSYTAGINVQNLSGSTGSITIEFFAMSTTTGTGGASVATVPDTIAGFGVKNYFPLTAVATGFQGSVVVSSSTPIAAVTNVSNADLSSLGAYNGASAGSTSVSLPILHKGNSGFDSWYSIQNAGGSVANVSIDYTSTGPGVDKTVQIAPSASVNINQATENHGTARLFAGTITSTNGQPLVVVALQENASNIMAYTGFASGSKMPVMPTINMNNSGYFTGTQIYNLGGTATNVTVTYTAGQFGTNCTETKAVPAGSMVVFTTSAFMSDSAGETCVAGQRFLGSARVTANSTNQDLAVVVNQLRAPTNVNGSSYNGFDPNSAGSSVFMPTIFDRNSGWYTAFNVMNVGNTTAYVKCTYANSSAVSTTGSAGLAPGASVTISQLNAISDRYDGSALCQTYTNNSHTTVDPNGKILTVVNELGPGAPDNLLSYEGINP